VPYDAFGRGGPISRYDNRRVHKELPLRKFHNAFWRLFSTNILTSRSSGAGPPGSWNAARAGKAEHIIFVPAIDSPGVFKRMAQDLTNSRRIPDRGAFGFERLPVPWRGGGAKARRLPHTDLRAGKARRDARTSSTGEVQLTKLVYLPFYRTAQLAAGAVRPGPGAGCGDHNAGGKARRTAGASRRRSSRFSGAPSHCSTSTGKPPVLIFERPSYPCRQPFQITV